MDKKTAFGRLALTSIWQTVVLISMLLASLGIQAEKQGHLDLSLVVQNEAGVGIDGVQVEVVALDGREQIYSQPPVRVNAQTNVFGNLQVELVAVPHLQLRLSKEGYYPSVQTIASGDWQMPGSKQIALPPITLVEQKPGRVMFTFAGDAMAARRYQKPLPGEPVLIRPDSVKQDIAGLLRYVSAYLKLADIASVNLETQLLERLPSTALDKSVTFYTPPEILAGLTDAGVDYVALGNNHMYDFGVEGLRKTLHALNQSQLQFSGAGLNEGQARQHRLVEIDTQKVAMHSYVGWPGRFVPNQVAVGDKGGAAHGTLENMQSDLLVSAHIPSVVQYHGGLEYSSGPSLIERTRLRGAIDAGADLAIGHHPHVLQGLELYQGKLIAYSLGNFLFDQYIYSTQLSMLLHIWMDGEVFHTAEVVPIYLNGYVPTPATGDIRFDILTRLKQLSDPKSLEILATGAHGKVIPRRADAHPMSAKPLELSHLDDRLPVALNTLGISSFTEYLTPLCSVPIADSGSASMPTSGTKCAANLRFGTDLLKRGSFTHAGEFGTVSRTWLLPPGAQILSAQDNQFLNITGAAVTGMKTFERAFRPSNPATLMASVASSCAAQMTFLLQRRDLRQTWREALAGGEKIEIGRVQLAADERRVLSFDFHTPRRATKGIRLLVEVEQNPGCELKLDDLGLVEWITPWIHPVVETDIEEIDVQDDNAGKPEPPRQFRRLQRQGTHIQVSR